MVTMFKCLVIYPSKKASQKTCSGFAKYAYSESAKSIFVVLSQTAPKHYLFHSGNLCLSSDVPWVVLTGNG